MVKGESNPARAKGQRRREKRAAVVARREARWIAEYERVEAIALNNPYYRLPGKTAEARKRAA